MPAALKLALVTDIHNGRDSLTKKGGAAVPLLHEFADFVGTYSPDLVVELGDRISDTNYEDDLATLSEVAARFDALSVPHRHLLGNHDLVHLRHEDNARFLGHEMHSSSMDLNGWHLVFWQANVKLTLHEPFLLGEEDLAWLKADLAGTNLPSVVFTHVPLDGASMTGNYYFQGTPQVATYGNIAAAQAIVSAAGNVAACIAGHVHWNNVSRIDGIPYLSLQSLTESFTTQGEPTGGWATIELDNKLRWQGFGGDPIELTVDIGAGNRRWTAPLPPLPQVARRRRSPKPLTGVDALIIDLDGVVYRGAEPIEGACELLSDVLASGRQVVAITNNARATSTQYQQKLAGMGLALPTDRILTSADALADHIATMDAAPRVFFAAPPALREAVLAIGAIEDDDAPDYVVAGMDDQLTVSTLSRAVKHLASGAQLLASNSDVSVPTAEGQAAEAGAVVAFLEAASGQSAQTFGKPNVALFQLALSRAGCSAAKAVVVGDTYDTDILGANRAGIRSVRVRSGNPENEDSAAIPTMVVDDITALRPLLDL